MYRLLAWFMEKFGKDETGYGGYWTFKIGALKISYECSWFIDHTNFHFNFYLKDKKLFYKLIEGCVPPCET